MAPRNALTPARGTFWAFPCTGKLIGPLASVANFVTVRTSRTSRSSISRETGAGRRPNITTRRTTIRPRTRKTRKGATHHDTTAHSENSQGDRTFFARSRRATQELRVGATAECAAAASRLDSVSRDLPLPAHGQGQGETQPPSPDALTLWSPPAILRVDDCRPSLLHT